MIFEGTFKSYDNNKQYYVKIGDTGVVKTIQDNADTSISKNIVCFGPDPITISTTHDDTFENVYPRSCTITLVANYNISRDVTANNYVDIPVIIRKNSNNGDIVFSGYVEPLSFNQSYNHTWNTIDLNCVDKLGILEYIKFHDILSSSQLENLDYMTPWSIINLIMSSVGLTTGMKSLANDQTSTTLINPYIFIGDTKDDWKDCKEVLSTIGKTYGCYFTQNGNGFLIQNILYDTNRTATTLTKTDFVDSDANLSLSEAYNQINLTCNIETNDNTIIDPFDNDMLTSPYSSLYQYMQECVVPGEGNHALTAFKDFIRRRSMLITNYDAAAKYNHYVQVYVNPLFDFGNVNYATQETQQASLDYVYNIPGSGGFFAFGRSANINNPKDTQSIHSVDTTKYFVINVEGHERENGNTIGTQTQNRMPICTVVNSNTTNFIPNDAATTNYIVISGKILLQPIVPKTGSSPLGWGGQNKWHYYKSLNTVQSCIDGWNDQRHSNNQSDSATMWHRTIPHPDNGDGAYYQQIFASGDDRLTLTGPIENDKLKLYQYKYSTYGNRAQVDQVDKVSVLVCRLKIGDKYCVERIDQANGLNKYEWISEDSLPTFEGHTLDYFTIGFNPKIDDYIIGTSFDICDTRTIEMNLSEKGTCIPISFDDKLHGTMTFEILGPYNIIWQDIKQIKHGWWIFGSTNWTSSDIPILEHVQSIFISNFKLKLVSDNAKINNASTDNDLVYSSSSNARYIESKDYDTDLCTSLTTEEATELGIDYNLTNNSILNTDYTPFYGFDYVDTGGTHHPGTKLEEARVYEQYQLWQKSREIVDVSIKLDKPEESILSTKYKFSSAWDFDNNAIFKCIGRDIDLKYDTMKLTLKNMN